MSKKKQSKFDRLKVSEGVIPPSISMGPKDRLFMFLRNDGRVVSLHEKHALTIGKSMKEYLGLLETNDPTMLDHDVNFYRKLHLPLIMPQERRRTISYHGHDMTYEEFYTKTGKRL